MSEEGRFWLSLVLGLTFIVGAVIFGCTWAYQRTIAKLRKEQGVVARLKAYAETL